VLIVALFVMKFVTEPFEFEPFELLFANITYITLMMFVWILYDLVTDFVSQHQNKSLTASNWARPFRFNYYGVIFYTGIVILITTIKAIFFVTSKTILLTLILVVIPYSIIYILVGELPNYDTNFRLTRRYFAMQIIAIATNWYFDSFDKFFR
jgi:hypothetical protein